MTNGLWLALRRVAVFAAIFTVASWAMIESPSVLVILNVQDRVQFFLGAAVFGAILPRLVTSLTARRMTPLHVHSIALGCGMAGLVIAAMSSVTWRAGGHSLQFVDGPSRIVFRNLYILMETGLLLTVVPADMPAKMIQIAKVLLVIGLLMTAMSYADHLPAWLRFRTEAHDFAPLGPDTDGRP